MRYLILFLDVILAIILLPFMILRALFTRPKKTNVELVADQIKVDTDTAVKNLSNAIKIPTVSMVNEGDSDKPFLAFQAFLDKTYPLVAKNSDKTIIHDYSLIYHIQGTDNTLKPVCMLAHQDVVPAPKEGWSVDPFGGEIKDGYIYGRGAQDMKGTLIAMMDALETLLASGFKPVRSLYFCFGHDEEPNFSEGAVNIVKYFKEKGIEMESVFDEGGAMLDGALLGIKGKTLAMVGACEKGYVDCEITTNVNGGHASNPSKKTAVGLLSKTIVDIVNTPMKAVWTPTVKTTFKTLSPHMNFLFKMLFVNRDILKPLLTTVLSMIPITNALIRTTFAPTMLEGSKATNVLPRQAKANVNVRIITGQTMADVKEHLENIAHKISSDTTVELIGGNDPTPYASTDSSSYKLIEKTICEIFPDTIPAPYMFIAGTDARYYYPVCKNVFRFTPFNYSLDDTTRIHALDERCKITDLEKAVRFFIRYISNACKE